VRARGAVPYHRSVVRTLAAAALVAAVCLASGPVRAQSASDQATAEALFKQARELMTAGRYAEACPKLAESQRLDPSAGTLLNLATCYERNGQLASAWVTYKEAATAAQRANEPDRAKLARSKVGELEPKLATLTITLAAGADLPDLVVKRDGEAVGRPAWGAPIPVDPGTHVVEATAAGRKPWKSHTDVSGSGAKATIEVPLLEPEAPPAAPQTGTSATTPPLPSSPPQPASPGSTQRLIAGIIGGVGIAGIGVGAAFGVIAKSHLNDANGHCQTPACDPTGLSAVHDARNAATISTIAFAAGGAVLAGGIVLYLTAPRSAPAAGLVVAPVAAPSFAGLSLRGGW
jgi:serine/threonine-protein kinase